MNADGRLDHLREYFLLELRRALWVERRLARQVLPDLAEAIEDEELKRAVEDHRAATEEQEAILLRVFALLGEQPQAERSAGLDGIVEEHEAEEAQVAERSLSDLVHAAAVRRTEHYELALYEQLIATARSLEEHEAAHLLDGNRLQEQRALGRAQAASEKLRGVLSAR